MARSEQYTRQVQELADQAMSRLAALAKMMREAGDEARAMDVEEGMSYVESAVAPID